jgi:polyisoprenoid-binding protein YceI
MSTVTAPQATAVTTWNIDPVHSNAQFKVKHMMISNVKGEFTVITGKLELNEADITKSRVEASIDAATINTREVQRDAHLKSADFLDVEKFPVLTFKSTRVSKEGRVELAVEGDLTIHVGRHPNRTRGNDAHQPKRLWVDLECRTGDRWDPRG